jgi:hypothetical protein
MGSPRSEKKRGCEAAGRPVIAMVSAENVELSELYSLSMARKVSLEVRRISDGFSPISRKKF